MSLIQSLSCRRLNVDAGSIAKCGIELGFDAPTASSLANPIRIALQLITLAREKGQWPENTDTCGFYCYPLRKADAGSVPYSTTTLKYQPILRLVFFCLLPRVHAGWRGFLRTSPKALAAVFDPVFSLRWPVLSVPAPTKIGQVLKQKI